MVTLQYGKRIVNAGKSKYLSFNDQRLLLDGKFVLETGLEFTETNKKKKNYYIGCLFEIFESNFYPAHSKKEIYAMMLIAYPLFINPRQIENVLFDYYELKKKKDVFAST